MSAAPATLLDVADASSVASPGAFFSLHLGCHSMCAANCYHTSPQIVDEELAALHLNALSSQIRLHGEDCARQSLAVKA